MLTVLACAGPVLGSMGCGERETPPNVLLISIDTLRRDVMKVYGDAIPMELTPSLDRWARRGVILDRCYTPVPRTSQSFAALFTGRTPTNNGVFGLYHELPQHEVTLAERLKDAGYRTSAVVTNPFLAAGRGFEQGFDLYDDFLVRSQSEFAESVADRVERLTLDDTADGPFFLWTHFVDPHWRYDPPVEILRELNPGFRGPFTLYADIDSSTVTGGSVIFENSLDAEMRKHMRRRYLGEINYLDRHVGRMLGILEARGMLENTVIVLYSDHGESLGEHDYYYAHGERLYEPTVHIPAVIIAPGVEPTRYPGLVSSEDLLPTLLEILGQPAAEEIDGQSFWGAVDRSDPSPRQTVYLESDYQLIHPENSLFQHSGPAGKMRAIIADGFKLIRTPLADGERFELYDLVEDPGETQNLIDDRTDMFEQLRPRLAEFDAIVDGQENRPAQINEAAAERIRSLGYIN